MTQQNESLDDNVTRQLAELGKAIAQVSKPIPVYGALSYRTAVEIANETLHFEYLVPVDSNYNHSLTIKNGLTTRFIMTPNGEIDKVSAVAPVPAHLARKMYDPAYRSELLSLVQQAHGKVYSA